jgi:hypothetical protein
MGLVALIYEKFILPRRVSSQSIQKMKFMLDNVNESLKRRGIYKWNTTFDGTEISITAEVEEIDSNATESKIKVNQIYVIPVNQEHRIRNESNAKQMMERWMPTKNIKWIQDSADRTLQRKLKK